MEILNKYEAAKILKQIANEFGIYIKGNCNQFHRLIDDEIQIDEDTDIVINTNQEENEIH